MIDERFEELKNQVLRLRTRMEWEDRAVIEFCVEAGMLRDEVKRLREDRKRLFMDAYEQGWEEALTAHDHGEDGKYFDVYRRNAWSAVSDD